MNKPHLKTSGFTLIEMLISMGIFGVISFLTFMLVSGALTYNARQQATTAAQGKLRRVTEVVSQELRGSVFGGVADSPYVSGRNQISLYLLEQGSGYAVTQTTPNSLTISANSQPTFKQVLLIDESGSAESYNVTTVTGSGKTWMIQHGCTSTLSGGKMLAFGVTSLGFRLDSTTNTLLLHENGVEYPMAFNITEFDLKYVYTANNIPDAKDDPIRVSGSPAKVATLAGVQNVLTELQFTLSTKELGRGEVERTYTGQVPLLVRADGSTAADTFKFSGVKVCN
jgi:prepilin-type N-terminal cleavage/methylation domain-containing protein